MVIRTNCVFGCRSGCTRLDHHAPRAPCRRWRACSGCSRRSWRRAHSPADRRAPAGCRSVRPHGRDRGLLPSSPRRRGPSAVRARDALSTRRAATSRRRNRRPGRTSRVVARARSTRCASSRSRQSARAHSPTRSSSEPTCFATPSPDRTRGSYGRRHTRSRAPQRSRHGDARPVLPQLPPRRLRETGKRLREGLPLREPPTRRASANVAGTTGRPTPRRRRGEGACRRRCCSAEPGMALVIGDTATSALLVRYLVRARRLLVAADGGARNLQKDCRGRRARCGQATAHR